MANVQQALRRAAEIALQEAEEGGDCALILKDRKVCSSVKEKKEEGKVNN